MGEVFRMTALKNMCTQNIKEHLELKSGGLSTYEQVRKEIPTIANNLKAWCYGILYGMEIVNVSFVFIAPDKPSVMIILQIRIISTYCWQPSNTKSDITVLASLILIPSDLLHFISGRTPPVGKQHHQAGF